MAKGRYRSFRVPAAVTLAAIALLAACAGTPEPRQWSECYPELTEGIAEERIVTAEVGSRDVVLLDADQSKDEAFVLVVTENRSPVLGVRINYFSDNEIFKLASVVDGSCIPVRKWDNRDRPGQSTLQNWDSVIIRTGGTDYRVRLGYHGSEQIRANIALQ
jgi:hypothetical protein